ncbi:GntR family transcriptional regulator [Pseudochrobactrum kiredjianiae]|uniref:GntR family transcriptional regulator n=1 Tax=Pseudochrobactrum kiredjianiae TaxID=386305 RepID=A0ABW3V4S4_9HYPH|nr:GntR family transcriptional regulator [Pseudochrobactrum kiredjianiae]MDM7850753.1 GntR family transcriptional regulator [Pseudochrobactrum kiredjianiae]
MKGNVLQNDKLSKVDCAYELLKKDILNLTIPPDTPLKMTWVQKQYNVGSTPLREALKRLEADRLVILHPNKGYVVSPVSIEEMMELYRARRLIKQQLLKEAMLFGDKSWEANIVAMHYCFVREPSPADDACRIEGFIAWAQAHDAFDSALLAAHRAPWLKRFYTLTTEHIRRHGRGLRILMPTVEWQEFADAVHKSQALRTLYAIETYTELKEAVLNRDFDLVAQFVDKHVDLVITANNEIHELNEGNNKGGAN